MTHAMLSPEKTHVGLSDRFNSWQLLTVISWLVMYLAGIVPAWSLISDVPKSWLAWLIFGLIALATCGASAVLALTHFKRSAAQFILMMLLILSLGLALRGLVFVTPGQSLLAMPPRFLGSFDDGAPLIAALATATAVIYLWHKGDVAWQHWIGPLVVRRTFISGTILFLGIGLLASAVKNRFPVLEFFLFLFTSLLAMGGSRLSAQAHVRGGRGVPLTRSWVLGLNGSALGLLGLAAATAFIAGGPVASLLAALFGRLFRGLLIVFLLVLEPLVYLIIAAWNVLLTCFGLGPDLLLEAPQISFDNQIQEQLAALSGEVQPPVWADDLGHILTWAGGLLVGVLVLVVIITSLRRNTRLRQWRSTTEQEIPGGESLFAALRSLLKSRKNSAQPARLLQPVRRWIAAARIRWIYSQLLRSLSRIDLERTASETPLEYLQRVSHAIPAGADDLASITHAYQRVRYGELPETRADIDQVEASWDRVQGVIRERKKLEGKSISP